MRRTLLTVLSCTCLVIAGTVRAEDDARAIISRAIAAQGNLRQLAHVGLAVQVKGIVYSSTQEATPFTGDLWSEPPHRVKFTLTVEVGLGRAIIAQGVDGENGWSNVDGRVEKLAGGEFAEMQRSLYVDRVVGLVALLEEKNFTLSVLGESKVQDRPVLGIKVASTGRPDVKLYFDRENRLLVKYEYRDHDLTSRMEVLHESLCSDYQEPDLGAVDEQTLKAVHASVEGPALVEWLRKQTPAAVEADHVKELIRRLGDDGYAVREKAVADLVALGGAAAPFLREAERDQDAEIARRAQECLRRIGDHDVSAQTAAVIRLLGLHRPDGTSTVLLDFLTRTRDEKLAAEARAALTAVALQDGPPDKALLAALEDKDARRKAAATAALGRDGGAYTRAPGRRLYLTGVKLPAKVISYADGKKVLERETIRVEFFNGFDAGVFARPKDGNWIKRAF